MFEVESRNGLARSGKWLIEGQEKGVKTPNIFFVEGEGVEAPGVAEVLVSEKARSRDKPCILYPGSPFVNIQDNIPKNSISRALFYPPSQTELNAHAAKFNKENQKSGIFIVAGKDEMTANAAFEIDAEVFVLPNALHLIRNPRSFISSLMSLREAVGYHKLIYTPGLGSPSHIPLLAYCGVDLFDSTSLILNAGQGNYLTNWGKVKKEEADESFCFCPMCTNKKKSSESILGHNYYAALSELNTVRNAIKRGELRELVESRIRSEPWMVSVLRLLDFRFYSLQEQFFPVSGGSMVASSNDSLYRPEVVRFRERVKERYRKPPHLKILLLLPCSAKKPYSFSKTHRMFRTAIDESGARFAVHEVIITSPLGVVPRELELFYPAQQYDIPVTGTWGRDEIAMIGDCVLDFLKKNCYNEVVVHLPSDYLFIGDYLDDFTSTSDDHTTSQNSLKKLTEVLAKSASKYDKVNVQTRLREEVRAIARYQFGEAGEALVLDAQIKGRYPNLKIIKEGEQVGMLVGERGMISLTLKGATLLAEQKAYWVKIDNFTPKGSIFAVGVLDADARIRIGDDVVVLRDDGPVGIGVAQMSPREMKESQRGEAVRMRHLVKKR